jgi:hypothetical protein
MRREMSSPLKIRPVFSKLLSNTEFQEPEIRNVVCVGFLTTMFCYIRCLDY